MTKNRKENWETEFRDFVSSSAELPTSLSQKIQARVQTDLYPNLWRVFGKGIFIHIIVAAFSLAICPQFGISFFGEHSHGLMGIYMVFGPSLCALFCGATFLGLSSLATAFLLRPEEVRRASEYGFAYFPLLTAISFGALMLGGGTAGLIQVIHWSLGAIFLGWAFLKLGAILRFQANRYLRGISL